MTNEQKPASVLPHKLGMIQDAVQTLPPDTPAAEVTRYIEERYGVTIKPMFIPIYKASLRDWRNLEAERLARSGAAAAAANQPAGEAPSAA